MLSPFVLLALIVFAFGINLGSFFNVVIYRMPRGLSVVSPPSACPVCKNSIKWYDNIPVFSWLLLLRGKCRTCKTPISIQYPMVELATGLLCVGALSLSFLLRGGIDFQHILMVQILVLAAVPIVVIDLKHFLIPDMIVFPALVAMMGASFIPGEMNWQISLLGAVVSAAGLWLFATLASKALKKEAMGMGDVKLMLLLGAFNGISYTIPTLVLASFLGLIYLGVQKALKKGEQGLIPFGPPLIFGALICKFWGEALMKLYWQFVGMGL